VDLRSEIRVKFVKFVSPAGMGVQIIKLGGEGETRIALIARIGSPR